MSEGGDEVSERDSEREGRGWSEGGRGKGRHLVHEGGDDVRSE